MEELTAMSQPLQKEKPRRNCSLQDKLVQQMQLKQLSAHVTAAFAPSSALTAASAEQSCTRAALMMNHLRAQAAPFALQRDILAMYSDVARFKKRAAIHHREHSRFCRRIQRRKWPRALRCCSFGQSCHQNCQPLLPRCIQCAGLPRQH